MKDYPLSTGQTLLAIWGVLLALFLFVWVVLPEMVGAIRWTARRVRKVRRDRAWLRERAAMKDLEAWEAEVTRRVQAKRQSNVRFLNGDPHCSVCHGTGVMGSGFGRPCPCLGSFSYSRQTEVRVTPGTVSYPTTEGLVVWTPEYEARVYREQQAAANRQADPEWFNPYRLMDEP